MRPTAIHSSMSIRKNEIHFIIDGKKLTRRRWFSDDVGKQVYHWTTRYFWQYPDQCEDFTALSVLLESEDLTNQQRLVIAKDVTKRIHQLHDKMFFQQDLKLDDIFINDRRMVTFHP